MAVDLLARLPRAETCAVDPPAETRRIDPSVPEARALLRGGWSRRVKDRRRGLTFVTNLRDRASLTFLVERARDLRLEIRCQPASREPGVALAAALNGTPLARIALEPSLARYGIPLPGERLRRGWNELTFLHEGESRGSDRAPVVAWYRMDFLDPAAPAAVADRARRRLFIPFGVQVDYFVETPPRSVLQVEGLDFRGAGELAVGVSGDGGEQGAAGSVARDVSRWRLPVGGEVRSFARLRLVARAASPASAEGGVRLVAPALWAPAPPPRPREPSAPFPLSAAQLGGPPNIVLYVVDTLRRDRLGCYGYLRPVSPHLDAFAREATLFEDAVGQSSWTRASMASLFTGLWPGSHGAMGRLDRLAPEATALAETLRAAGYRTAAIVTQPNVDKVFGFDQGFDSYARIDGKVSSEVVHQAAVRWLDGPQRAEPFFLYLHTVDPHDPYVPAEKYRRRYAPGSEDLVAELARHPRRRWPPTRQMIRRLGDLYDAEIATNDDRFGALLEALRQRGLFDEALVVFVSDHGEEFQEHGAWTHGKNLHVETLDVALLVKFPRQRKGLRNTRPVQHADLVPTLLDYLGLEAPPGLDGRSLIALLGGADADGETARIFSHLHLLGALNVSVVAGDWKLMQRRFPGDLRVERLFDRRRDPAEREDLAAARPITAAALRAMIEEKLAEGPRFAREEAVLDPQTAESLRALGYLP